MQNEALDALRQIDVEEGFTRRVHMDAEAIAVVQAVEVKGRPHC